MKNVARWYSEQNLGCEPWIWSECHAPKARPEVTMSLVEWEQEEERNFALANWAFVTEDANRPGDIQGFDTLEEANSFIKSMNDDGCAFFLYWESRGLQA